MSRSRSIISGVVSELPGALLAPREVLPIVSRQWKRWLVHSADCNAPAVPARAYLTRTVRNAGTIGTFAIAHCAAGARRHVDGRVPLRDRPGLADRRAGCQSGHACGR